MRMLHLQRAQTQLINTLWEYDDSLDMLRDLSLENHASFRALNAIRHHFVHLDNELKREIDQILSLLRNLLPPPAA